VFDLMIKDGIQPNEVTYNAIIDAYAKNRQIEKASEVFDSMKKDGIQPDEVTFRTIIDCFAKSGKHLHEMMKMVKEMRESSFELDIRAWNNIIEGYSRVDGEKDQIFVGTETAREIEDRFTFKGYMCLSFCCYPLNRT
jgi:pentatricopeptide repeat protein